MKAARWTWLFLCAVVATVTTSAEEAVICLTSDIYAQTLKCQSPEKILVHDMINYGVNAASCVEACCPENLVCSAELATAENIFSSCNGQLECQLYSIIDIPLRPIECPGNPRTNATFASITYSCVDEITSPSTSSVIQSTTTLSPTAASITPSIIESSTNNMQETSRKNMIDTSPTEKTGDLPLVVGLSVAGGVIIIAVVMVIAVCTTRNKRQRAYDSHNSTKTLATSDVESSSPGSGQNSEDVFGFTKSAEGRQERLQKRNDEIKRNQSFKSEEKKNKRPPKLNKHKSKSKSSSLDQLSSSKPKGTQEIQKSKQTENAKRQSGADKTKEDKKNDTSSSADAALSSELYENLKAPEKPKPKMDPESHPADAKSETNLLSI